MRRSLQGKLVLSYLAVALITVLVVSIIIRMTSGQYMFNLVVEQQTALLEESAQTYYSATGTMEGFLNYYLQTSRSEFAPQESGSSGGPPQSRNIRGLHGLVDAEYHALIPTFSYEIGQVVPAHLVDQTQAIPVVVNRQTVAWILPDKGFQFKLSDEEELFLQRTNLAIAFAALGGVLAAMAMGFWLSARLLKPIRRLTKASQALALGDLEQQVPVNSDDELGQLTSTFNQMSADLVKADQQRKRMTADITHDLSTPLQVISGYIEMVEEGGVDLTPQRIEIIKTEIDHLRRLVSDLSTLSQVEANRLDIQLNPVKPVILLERIYHAYQPIAARQGIELVLDGDNSVPNIIVDEGRMLQVLKNLVENSLRYTPKQGKIVLSATNDDQVQLHVTDNGTGIDADDLPYVFDRFFRADKSRDGNTGKMGLGLAICKALVTAQGGTITAISDGKNQGTTIVITFDAAPP